MKPKKRARSTAKQSAPKPILTRAKSRQIRSKSIQDTPVGPGPANYSSTNRHHLRDAGELDDLPEARPKRPDVH